MVGNKKKKKKKDEVIQGQMLQKSKDTEGFSEIVGLGRSTVYFKIGSYKCLKKFPALNNSILSLNYFRNNFKFIKTVCKCNGELFL